MNSRIAQLALACLFTALLVTPSLAAKKDKDRKDPTAGLQKKLQTADLPSDVREKANKVLADYGPKVRNAQAASEAILTPEQKASRAVAQKSAKDAKSAGTKRKNAKADVAAALKLSDEQKPKYAEAEKELTTAQAALTNALRGVLTADQQAAVGLKTKKKKNA